MKSVVPCAGTWIETMKLVKASSLLASFPVRERGLKQSHTVEGESMGFVVPRAGTWIETSRIPPSYSADPVVPLVETCIETRNEEVRLGVTVESYFLICSKSFFKRVAAVNRSRTMQS